jgi:PPM family protein phosphatase
VTGARPSLFTVEVAGESNVGLVRSRNEDALLIASLDGTPASTVPAGEEAHLSLGEHDSAFLLVADGVGGAAGGDIASRLASQVLLERVGRARNGLHSSERIRDALENAMGAANSALNEYAATHDTERDMATTATAVVLWGGSAHIAHVGDSRAYIVRTGVAYQITRDQSLVQQLVDRGEITAEEAARSRRKNIILQAVGGGTSVQPELLTAALAPGDAIIVCSDGLSNQVTPEEMAILVDTAPSARDASRGLVGRALEMGAPDNVTVIVARVLTLGTAAAPHDTDDRGLWIGALMLVALGNR